MLPVTANLGTGGAALLSYVIGVSFKDIDSIFPDFEGIPIRIPIEGFVLDTLLSYVPKFRIILRKE
ncbi:hypothetical protein GCM10023142_29860 [Anaerocolumna aminovalerica]|jgi:hypothetical protein